MALRDANQRVDDSLDELLNKLNSLKSTLQNLLAKIDHHSDAVQWPDMLDTLALCSNQLAGLSRVLRADRLVPVQSLAFLPLQLSDEEDPRLFAETEGRLAAATHESLPHYLRTKLEPEIEARRSEHLTRAAAAPILPENKAVSLNKMASGVAEVAQQAADDMDESRERNAMMQSVSVFSDTQTLVAAVSIGLRLRDVNFK